MSRNGSSASRTPAPTWRSRPTSRTGSCWPTRPSRWTRRRSCEVGRGAVVLGYNRAMAYRDAPQGWWREFVAAAPARTGKLAVVRADGSPHVAPVWVDLDGDDVVFMTSADTVKGKAILRDPRVSLCWDDERPPFSFVTVAGTAALSTDAATLLHWATRIGARYMGADRA